jgi:hypothetical protein
LRQKQLALHGDAVSLSFSEPRLTAGIRRVSLLVSQPGALSANILAQRYELQMVLTAKIGAFSPNKSEFVMLDASLMQQNRQKKFYTITHPALEGR